MHKKICIYAKIVVLLHVFVCMSRLLLHIVYLLCAGLAMWSCAGREAYTGKVESNAYAKGFVIEPQADYTVVKAFSPWQEGQTLATYYLVRSDSIATPKDGIRIRIPVQRMALTSCTHVGFLMALNQQNVIYGICDPHIVYNQSALQPSDGHEVMNLGDAMTPDVERIMRANPDAVMVSTYAQGDAATAKMCALGLPVIFNNEWTETHPLARAEWIRFVGALLDCLPQADSVFTEVEEEYKRLAVCDERLAVNDQDVNKRPTIMSGNNFRGTWYMPAGSTYMGVLFKDAGADYKFANDTSHFSIPLTIESVIADFSEADVWVGCPARSLAELAQMDARHTWFKAYKEGRVYNFLHRTTVSGGNDFWETGVVHPELILKDLRKVITGYGLRETEEEFYFVEHLK